MKKRIAVLAGGWDNVNLHKSLIGLTKYTNQNNYDVYLFLSFSTWSESLAFNEGEDTIFTLPNLDDFDGVVVYSSTFNSLKTIQLVTDALSKTKIPKICVGLPLADFPIIKVDSYSGMYELVTHLIEDCKIKNPYYIAGPKDHEDSNQRLQALKDNMAAHGLTFNEKNISYCNWEYLTTQDAVEKILKDYKDNLPDCFVCANDHGAITTTSVLQHHGFKVPEDIVVSGFDNMKSSQLIYPSITTVDQNYEELGYNAALHLEELINHKNKTTSFVIPSEMVLGESSGAYKKAGSSDLRKQYCSESYAKEMENIIFQTYLNNLVLAFTAGDSPESFQSYAIDFFDREGNIGCQNTLLIADKAAISDLRSDSGIVYNTSFSEKMYTIYGKYDGVDYSHTSFNKKELLPFKVEKESPSLFTFFPLHYDTSIFGYIVFEDALDLFLELKLSQYSDKINHSLENFRQNVALANANKKLRNLSERDALTGLYNRFGLEYYGLPLFQDSKESLSNCVIIFVDVNRMKYINDNFGHLHGDLTLRTISSSILATIPDNWLAIRYGGDEFVILGKSDDKEYIEGIIASLNKNLKIQVRKMSLPYPLTVSAGYIITDYNSSKNLEQYITEADKVMYIHKQQTYKDGL